MRSFVLHICYLVDFFFLNSLASFPEFIIEPFENNTAGLSWTQWLPAYLLHMSSHVFILFSTNNAEWKLVFKKKGKRKKRLLKAFSLSSLIAYLHVAQLQHCIYWRFLYQPVPLRFYWTAKEHLCLCKIGILVNIYQLSNYLFISLFYFHFFKHRRASNGK